MPGIYNKRSSTTSGFMWQGCSIYLSNITKSRKNHVDVILQIPCILSGRGSYISDVAGTKTRPPIWCISVGCSGLDNGYQYPVPNYLNHRVALGVLFPLVSHCGWMSKYDPRRYVTYWGTPLSRLSIMYCRPCSVFWHCFHPWKILSYPDIRIWRLISMLAPNSMLPIGWYWFWHPTSFTRTQRCLKRGSGHLFTVLTTTTMIYVPGVRLSKVVRRVTYLYHLLIGSSVHIF